MSVKQWATVITGYHSIGWRVRTLHQTSSTWHMCVIWCTPHLVKAWSMCYVLVDQLQHDHPVWYDTVATYLAIECTLWEAIIGSYTFSLSADTYRIYQHHMSNLRSNTPAMWDTAVSLQAPNQMTTNTHLTYMILRIMYVAPLITQRMIPSS